MGSLFLFPTIVLSTRVPSLADQRCPCKESTECAVRFAEMNPAAQDAVLQFIPTCPSFQGRCCTTEAMLLTIIALSQRQAPNPALPTRVLLSPRHRTQPTQDTALPAEELPCVQPAACSEVYGVKESHFDDHGLQFACQTSTEVRCVAEVTLTAATTTGSTTSTTVREVTTRPTTGTATTSPSSEPEMLPCLHPSLCLEEYGTLVSHFTSHGLFFPLLTTAELTVTRPTTTPRAGTSRPTTTR